MWPFSRKPKPNPNAGLTLEQRLEANIAAAVKCHYCGADLSHLSSDARMNHYNQHINEDQKLRGVKGIQRLGL